MESLTRLIEEDIDEIDGHKLWCETEQLRSYTESVNWTPRMCNFPFKLNGEYLFKPYTSSEGYKKCTVVENTFNMKPGQQTKVDWENPKVFNESELVDCSPCPGI